MDNIWDKIDLELIDRILSSTSFNDDQIRLLSEALQSYDKILDLCIGFGNLAKILVGQGKTVYGIDISPRSLEYAKRKVGNQKAGKLYLVEGDGGNLEYDSEFDVVSCASSFCLSDTDPAACGIYKALRPGGGFAVTGFESCEKQKSMELMQSELSRKIEDGSLVITPEEIEKLQEYEKIIVPEAEDSSKRVLASLMKNNFQIRRVESFFHDTAYFILAQKE